MEERTEEDGTMEEERTEDDGTGEDGTGEDGTGEDGTGEDNVMQRVSNYPDAGAGEGSIESVRSILDDIKALPRVVAMEIYFDWLIYGRGGDPEFGQLIKRGMNALLQVSLVVPPSQETENAVLHAAASNLPGNWDMDEIPPNPLMAVCNAFADLEISRANLPEEPLPVPQQLLPVPQQLVPRITINAAPQASQGIDQFYHESKRIQDLSKIAPAAYRILQLAFEETGMEIYNFMLEKLQGFLEKGVEPLSFQLVFDLSWYLMEAYANLHPDSVVTIIDDDGEVVRGWCAAAIVFHRLGRYHAWSKVTEVGRRMMSQLHGNGKRSICYRFGDNSRFETKSQIIRTVSYVFDIYISRFRSISPQFSSLFDNKQIGPRRLQVMFVSPKSATFSKLSQRGRLRPLTDEEAMDFIATLPTLFHPVSDLGTSEDYEYTATTHLVTNDSDRTTFDNSSTVFGSHGTIVDVGVIDGLHENINPTTRNKVKGAKSHGVECISGRSIGKLFVVRVHKLSLDGDRRNGGYVRVRNKHAHVIIGEKGCSIYPMNKICLMLA